LKTSSSSWNPSAPLATESLNNRRAAATSPRPLAGASFVLTCSLPVHVPDTLVASENDASSGRKCWQAAEGRCAVDGSAVSPKGQANCRMLGGAERAEKFTRMNGTSG
jgi:hypothetical protein